MLLVGPVWMGSVAAPLRAYMKRLKQLECPYAFATISGGADGHNLKIKDELTRRVKRAPLAVLDMTIADLMQKEPKPTRDDTSAYKITVEDVENPDEPSPARTGSADGKGASQMSKAPKKERKRKKMGWIITLIIVVVLGAGGAIGWQYIAREHKEAMSLPLNAVDFSKLEDGVYTGEYEGGMYKWRTNKVEVTVEGGKVTSRNVAGIEVRRGSRPIRRSPLCAGGREPNPAGGCRQRFHAHLQGRAAGD